MKFVFISDTHGQHNVPLPQGDVLVHAGDVSKRGKEEEIIDFLSWFGDLPFQHKVFIAGNHDFFFEQASPEVVNQLIPEGVTYLNDSGCAIGGLHLWGSPIQPWFFDWAFNRQRGADIRKHWDLIPSHTDILITHGPAYGILDKTVRGEPVGCRDLLRKIQEVKPKVHVAGHIHEAYGAKQMEETLFLNASVLDVNYKMEHEPIVWESSDH